MPSPDNPASIDRPLHGFLLVDKPIGLSSMQAVARIRRAAGGARTGHAGTLDPLATGLLVMAIGKATRSLQHLTGLDKRYHTLVDLGAFTTTDDTEGEREEVNVPNPPTLGDIQRALQGFTGDILQKPPLYSAVKIAGRRAYKLARRGHTPEMPPRHVTLHQAVVTEYEWPMLGLELHTGSGFYVRSLARDLGGALGTGGHCAAIRRTAVGPFNLEGAVTLDDMPEHLNQHDLIPVEDVLANDKSS